MGGRQGHRRPDGDRPVRRLADAADDPRVGPVPRRVSERRVDYLEACYRALGFPAEEALHRALLAYAAYVGTMRLAREVPRHVPRADDFGAYRRHLIATLIPEAGPGGTAPA